MPDSNSPSLRRRIGAAGRRLAGSAAPPAPAVHFVMRDYYEAQLGRTFDSTAAAEQDYLDAGWKLGILPNPFVDPAARQSLEQAQQLRTAVEDLLAGRAPEARWTRPDERFDLTAMTRAQPESLRHLGGPGGYLLAAAKAPRTVSVRLGPEPTAENPKASEAPPMGARSATVSWAAYRTRLGQQASLVRTILDGQHFDVDYYQQQCGLEFLSPAAALSDYIERGEDAGLAPHPLFEPEWFAAFRDEDGVVESDAPICRFLDFIARGRSDQAGPADTAERTGWASPLAPSDLADLARRQSLAWAADDAARSRGRAPLTRHVVAGPRGEIPSSASVLILVDGRSLREDSVAGPFSSVLAQEHQHWTCRLVLPDESVPGVAEIAHRLADLDDRIEVDRYAAARTIGSVMEDLRAASAADLLVFWDPSQIWDPTFLATAADALDRHLDTAVAVTSAPRARHSWLTKDDPLWLASAPFAPGLVVRTRLTGLDPLICTDLDGALEWDIVTRLGADHKAAILPERLLRIDRSQPVETRRSMRRLTNEVRARRLLKLDSGVPRVTGRVSMLMPTFEDWWMTERAVRAVLENSDEHDVEIIVLDNGSRRCVSAILTSAFAGEDRVTILRAPRNCDFALGSNLALQASTGEYVVFLNNDTTVTPGWLPPLVEAVDSGAAAAQPLLVYPDGTIQTAGTIFLGSVTPPTHLLASYPAEDAHPSIGSYPFSAVTAACMLLRADDALQLGGFDASYVNGMEDVDLCLRLGDATGRPLRVVPSARVVHHESQSPGRFTRSLHNRELFIERWRGRLGPQLDDRGVLDQASLELAGLTSHRTIYQGQVRTAEPFYSRPARVVEHGPAAGLPSLRWAIKIAAPNTADGDVWGDTFFAHDLAASLRALGQEVVIDRADTYIRPQSDHLDDVNLALRGLRRFQPQPGTTNLLWVISHPDLVLVDELRAGWDRIYSAGPAWAQQMSAASHVQVEPLLQATNAERFTPTGERLDSDVLFVGRTRQVFRPIVRDAIAAGAKLSLYGDGGWEDLIDPAFIKGKLMPNEQLPAAYRGARVVLNDHWEDMAAHGFLSNRLFDAAAAGALIATDSAVGIDEVFGATVRTYSDVESLRALLQPDATGWPTTEDRLAEADRIRAAHSFDVRARQLLTDVLQSRGVEAGQLTQ